MKTFLVYVLAVAFSALVEFATFRGIAPALSETAQTRRELEEFREQLRQKRQNKLTKTK